MNIFPSVHTIRRTEHAPGEHARVYQAIANCAYGNTRLLPVIWKGRIIAWGGWSWKKMATVFFEHKPWMKTEIDEHGLYCGFTTVDDIITMWTTNAGGRQLFWFKALTASVVLGWSHLYGVAGSPGAGAWSGTAFTARQHSDAEVGALYHGGNVSTATKHILSGFVRTTNPNTGELYVFCLYDMVISYDQCALSTTPTSFTNTLTAQRYNGSGLLGLSIMGCHNSAPAGTQNYSALTYTNQAGTTAQAVPSIASFSQFSSASTPGPGIEAMSCFALTNSNVRTVLSLPLVNGDTGVRKLESLTMGATNTDTHNYILGFQLAWCPTHVSGEDTYPFDLTTQIPSLPRIVDGACLTLAMSSPGGVGGAALNWHGGFNVGWA